MWASFIALSLGIAFALFARRIVVRRKRNPRGLPLPPGPKGLPLLGNVFQLPQAKPWEGYQKLCKEYGDMIYLTALGNGVLVLGSHRRAVDLLDKRSANYSDRPASIIFEMTGMGWSFALMRYGTRWRQHSRAFHKYFTPTAVQQFHPIMYEETKAYLRKVSSHPNDIIKDTELLFGTEIIRVAYGFDDHRQNETLIDNAMTVITRIGDATLPGRYLVDIFPALRHVPSWFPGAGFKKDFEELSRIIIKTLFPPFEGAKSNFRQGGNGRHPSIAADLISSLPEESDPNYAALETVARNVSGLAFVAGAETTGNSGVALLYILANYPEVQAKAQAEIDAVVGSGRLPLITDRENLPYVHAFVKEVGRWYTVLPLGVPHCNSEDDEYDGYFIPKGTIIFQSNWATMHDPDVFENPFEFIPERYIKDGKIDPSVPDASRAAFGYGRRICPGRHFSNDALFLLAASLLATHTLKAPKDENGNVAPMKISESQNQLVSKPLPFKCEVTLRPGRKHLLE